jgi:hypothetical protein
MYMRISGEDYTSPNYSRLNLGQKINYGLPSNQITGLIPFGIM